MTDPRNKRYFPLAAVLAAATDRHLVRDISIQADVVFFLTGAEDLQLTAARKLQAQFPWLKSASAEVGALVGHLSDQEAILRSISAWLGGKIAQYGYELEVDAAFGMADAA